MVEGFLYVIRRNWYFSYKTKHQFAVQTNIVKLSLGDLSDVGTPGPIPNPVVKHVSADGTWRATSWESRSLPRDFFFLTFHAYLFFCVRIVYNYKRSFGWGTILSHSYIKWGVWSVRFDPVIILAFLFEVSSAESAHRPIFFFLGIPCGKEVTCFGICKFT